MAETNLRLIRIDSEKLSAQRNVILVADSQSSIPQNEYIYFKAIFDTPAGQIARVIKDSEGNDVKITSISDMVVLDFNYLTIQPVYYGSNMPNDLKVYQF